MSDSAQSHAQEWMDSWPHTIDEAVARTLAVLTEDQKMEVRLTPLPDLARFHFGIGSWMRFWFGLGATNYVLLDACGTRKAEYASHILTRHVWHTLHDSPEYTDPDIIVPALIANLIAGDDQIRRYALAELATSGDERAIPAVVGTLADPSLVNRFLAVRILAKFAPLDGEVTRVLHFVADDPEEHQRVRDAARRALAQNDAER